jgi:hypothetical protein
MVPLTGLPVESPAFLPTRFLIEVHALCQNGVPHVNLLPNQSGYVPARRGHPPFGNL